SNDTYSVNITLASCGNITTLTWSEGLHNVTVWANDTTNNVNKSAISFRIDSVKPDLNITSPINKTESADTGLDVLYTRSDINLESCWYSNDSYSVNTTLASCGNLTTITWVVGPHNVSIYVNDSAGNQNRTSVTFNITSSDSDDSESSSGGSAASGSGGGGGGSTKSSYLEKELIIDSQHLRLSGSIRSEKTRELKIINDGKSSRVVSINSIDTGSILDINSMELIFELKPGESKIITLKFKAPSEPGIYISKFKINKEEVLITFDVSSLETIFDVSIVVPDEIKIINLGEILESQVTLIPIGEDVRFDVTSKYMIKNFDGKTFLSESETFLIDGTKTFKKRFKTSSLPTGDYFVAIELIYPNGVAVSSSYFKIKNDNFYADNFNLLSLLIIFGIFILVILIFYMMTRYKKDKVHKFRRRK
ncbi:MAG: hypothetical protein AABW83_02295, partial [Nanoarchaeota archaeon]